VTVEEIPNVLVILNASETLILNVLVYLNDPGILNALRTLIVQPVFLRETQTSRNPSEIWNVLGIVAGTLTLSLTVEGIVNVLVSVLANVNVLVSVLANVTDLVIV